MGNQIFRDSGLAGKTAIVTGGSRGIGRAIVELLAGEGIQVTFVYLQGDEAAEQVVAAVRGQGGEVSAERVDVRDSAQCDAMVERVAERWGRVDVLVNNSGIARDNVLGALADSELREVLDTNVVGVFNMTRAVVPHMVSRRSGKIINVSSVTGDRGGRGQTSYAASKGAINAFTRALAVELAPRNILVNAVAPGVIVTQMSEMVRLRAEEQAKSAILLGRFGLPCEVAYGVLFLISKYADYITGQVLNIDGGFKMR